MALYIANTVYIGTLYKNYVQFNSMKYNIFRKSRYLGSIDSYIILLF